MKREFKVGDRVAVYSTISDNGSKPHREVGRVDYVGDDGLLRVTVAHWAPYFVHPKCCRRLIRRNRRAWKGEWHCNYMPDGSVRALFNPDAQDGLPKNGERMTLVEARPRKAGRG